MVETLPVECRVAIEEELRARLHESLRALRPRAPEDYYEVAVQDDLHEALASRCPEELEAVVSTIAKALRKPPFVVLVRGLPFDDEALLLLGLARSFGVAVAPPFHPPRQQLLHRVQSTTDIRAQRAGARHESERLHTDCADWIEPPRWLAMTCTRSDLGGGGKSRVLDELALRTEVRSRLGDDALAWLSEQTLPWSIAGYRGGGACHRAPLAAGALRWRRYTIDAALRDRGQSLSREAGEILDALDEILVDPRGMLEFDLQANDLLFLDNHRALHSRSPLSSHPRAGERLMIRTWIMTNGETEATS